MAKLVCINVGWWIGIILIGFCGYMKSVWTKEEPAEEPPFNEDVDAALSAFGAYMGRVMLALFAARRTGAWKYLQRSSPESESDRSRILRVYTQLAEDYSASHEYLEPATREMHDDRVQVSRDELCAALPGEGSIADWLAILLPVSIHPESIKRMSVRMAFEIHRMSHV